MKREAFGLLFALLLGGGPNVASAQGVSPPDLGASLHTARLLGAGDRGQGVRVGVISDGASKYSMLVSKGVLPSGVEFCGRDPSRGDEGDWMMQIVHQVAPQARLAFCPGGSPEDTVGCARELVNRFHVGLIVDDTNPQPVFEFPSPKALGMAELRQEHPSLLFFTGAGNNGGGYYEGRWTPTPLLVNGSRYLAQDFGTSLGGDRDPYDTFVLPPGYSALVMLGTNADPTGQPLHCVSDNPEITLDLVDARGKVLKSASGSCPLLHLVFRQLPFPLPRRGSPFQAQRTFLLQPNELPFGSRAPFPFYPPQQLRVAVLLPEGSRPRDFTLKLTAVLVKNGVSPLTLGHRTDGAAGNSATMQGLIAVSAVDPNSGSHDQYLYEAFANSGPQCLDYAQRPSGAWTRLPTPRCVQQPALVVPDRAMVLMPTSDGDEYKPFVGDSSAGPAAAGVSALLLSAHVPAGRILSLLERSAIAQSGEQGWDPHYGYGVIDADAAAVMAGVLPPSREDLPGALPAAEPALFHPSPTFLRDGDLVRQAEQSDDQSLEELQDKARGADVDAQYWLAMYEHDAGDNASAARWAMSAATEGQPAAQSFLGSMYNRGWGVPTDPRAAQAWWLRAARAGVNQAIYNMSTVAGGRGAPANPVLGYAFMRAAALRGMHFKPMQRAISRARASLTAQQIQDGETIAARFAADPASIPVP